MEICTTNDCSGEVKMCGFCETCIEAHDARELKRQLAMVKSINFIRQTAKDYDLNIEVVRKAYENEFDSGLFYDKLEEILKENQGK